LSIRNLTRDTELAALPRLADTVGWQLRGMIGRRFDTFDALVFNGCRAIHTCFMGMPIDVLFVDAEGGVRGVRTALRPWRFAAEWRATRVVELPAGRLAEAPVAVGDRLDVDLG
jgi:uncharacterized membrane protein (UPF0127 family)